MSAGARNMVVLLRRSSRRVKTEVWLICSSRRSDNSMHIWGNFLLKLYGLGRDRPYFVLMVGESMEDIDRLRP